MSSYAVGIDIGGTKIEIALIDSEGVIIKKQLFPTESGHKKVQEEIVSAVGKLIKSTGMKPQALGVGVAGQVEFKTGVIKFAPNLKWSNVPLQEHLHQALGLPSFVINDVRAGVWGEWMHGAGKGRNDLVCLFIGTGIGSGIVSEGALIRGCSNSAGEIGHTVIDLNGPYCTCGNRGCLEAFAGGWALAKRAQNTIQVDPLAGGEILILAEGDMEKISARHVLGAAEAGNVLGKQIVEEAVSAIAIGCVNILNSLNPSMIVLGGGLGLALPNLLTRVREAIDLRALKIAAENVEVKYSKLENDAVVVGAASYALMCTTKSRPSH